jgi:hypothetical protein
MASKASQHFEAELQRSVSSIEALVNKGLVIRTDEQGVDRDAMGDNFSGIPSDQVNAAVRPTASCVR